MKLTLNRKEIEKIVKQHFQIPENAKFKLEILSDDSEKPAAKLSTKTSQPEVEYDITIDDHGFITDMAPKRKDATGKLREPIIDIRGRKFNYENTCCICGKTFFTQVKPASCCSAECIDKRNKKARKAAKDKVSTPKKKSRPRNNDKPIGSPFKIPAEPKIDCTQYGIKIEEFLKSDQNSIVVPLEGLTPIGMVYRYTIAANMFGYREKVKLNASRSKNQFIMSKA